MTDMIDKSDRIDRRRVLITALAGVVVAGVPAALSASKRPPRVLFICQFGTAKSAIARELLKRRALQRGVSVPVFSRGITPEPHLSSATRDTLLAEGIVLDREATRKLRKRDLGAADIVVFFNPLPDPFRQKAQRDWSSVPSVNDSFPLARADLDRRIDLLIDEIAQMRP
jgi:protein-tyrosine-phosphatase